MAARASIVAMGLNLLLAAAAPAADYSLGRSIAGPDGGWDYAAVDAGVLYVARSRQVMAVDLASRAVSEFGAIEGGHAVLPVGDALLVASGHDNSVRLFDLASHTQIARIALDAAPDSAAYDPGRRLAYVIEAKAGVVAVIDPRAGRLVATIAVAPGLEFPAIGGGRLYINNEKWARIEVVDTVRRDVLAPIALPGCQGPSGLAFDPGTRRLISACDNGQAAIVDPVKRTVALIAIGRRPDAVMMDAARRRAFIPCGGDGVLDVLALDGPGGIRLAQRLASGPGARTGAVDPRNGTVYLPSAEMRPSPIPGKWPTPVPGTFRVLMVRPG